MRCRLALAFALLLGCPSPLERTDQWVSPAAGDEAPRTPISAYVVVSTDETLLIPLEEAEPLRRVRGVWILDEETGHVVRPPPDPEALGRPWCVSSGAPGTCSLPPRIRVGIDDPLLDPSCTCFTSPETETCGEDPFALGFDQWATRSGVRWDQILARRPRANTVERAPPHCEETSTRPVSLHAGVLYTVGFAHERCGVDGHRAWAESEALVSDARAATRPTDEAWSCAIDGAYLDDWAVFAPAEGCTHDGGSWREANGGGCEGCEPGPDSVVPFLHNGLLFFAAARVQDTGSGPHYSATASLEGACTPSDPCGALTSIPAIAERASDTALGFVAHDERSGVLVERGSVHLYVSPRTAPVRRAAMSAELLGVRYHRDASRLIDAIDREAPEPEERPCPPGEVLRGANCMASCATNLDCRSTGPCNSVCVEGACTETTIECAEAHPCAAGFECEGYLCAEIPLAASDASFEDTHGGNDWSDRCVAHLRAGELDAAEAACAAGLDAYERESTHGALLYDLGRIALRRGDTALARLYFEASLVVRPNAIAERALRDAGGPLPP